MKWLPVLSLMFFSACVPSYEEDYNAAISSGQQLLITEAYTIPPPRHQLAGELVSSLTNISSKTIKYVHFNISSYNSVGDKVGRDKKHTVTGPLAPERSGSWSAWVESSCSVINSVSVEYTDGSKISFGSPSEVAEIMRAGLSNSCRV